MSNGQLGWSNTNRDRDVIRAGESFSAQGATLSFPTDSLNRVFSSGQLRLEASLPERAAPLDDLPGFFSFT